MGFTNLQHTQATRDASGSTTVTITITSTTAGALHACLIKHEATTTTLAVSDGTTSFTGLTKFNVFADCYGQWFYNLTGNGGKTSITCTVSSSSTWIRCHFWEYSYTGTCSFDVEKAGTGTPSASVSTGNFTTTSSGAGNGLTLAAYCEYSTNTVSNNAVNGVTAGVIVEPGTAAAPTETWGLVYDAGFTGAATGSVTSTDWLCIAAAFKATGGGGATGKGRLIALERNMVVRF